MPKYVQVKQPDGSYKLVEYTPGARGRPRLQLIGTKVHENFKSIIDGEVIQSQRQLREHMARHNVVHQSEFGPNNGEAWFKKKALERHKFWTGEGQAEEIRKDVIAATEQVAQGYKPKLERMPDDE